MAVELPKNIRQFIVRDLVFLTGGGSVLTSFLYCFDRLPRKETPVAFYLLGAGVAYVIGCALQDLFSIARIVTTGPVPRPGKFLQFIYRSFTGEEWTDLERFDPSEARQAIRDIVRSDEAAVGLVSRQRDVTTCFKKQENYHTRVAASSEAWRWFYRIGGWFPNLR